MILKPIPALTEEYAYLLFNIDATMISDQIQGSICLTEPLDLESSPECWKSVEVRYLLIVERNVRFLTMKQFF